MKVQNKLFLDEMLKENEVKTNYFTSVSSFLLSLIFIFYILTLDYDSDPNGKYMQLFLIIFLIILLVIPLITIIYRGKKPWLKYLSMIGYILTAACGTVFVESGIYVLLMMLPITVSCLYYNPKFTFVVGIISIVILISTCSLIALCLPILYPDVNFIILPNGVKITTEGYVYFDLIHAPIDRVSYFIEMCTYLLIPMFLIFLLVLIICCMITARARGMISKQADTIQEKIANESELNLAASIQKNMLPKEKESNSSYDVDYYISPAKQVAGDFYDFFKISDDKLALIIADVSDKGVPASLFMAICKTLLSSSLLSGKSLKETVNKVNQALCNNSSSGMFVTAFIGIVDINTGEVEYINAGHCCPIIMKNSGVFEFEKVNIDIFLGAMGEVEYESHKFTLNNYEKLVLYTDGVIEAENDKDELFGKDRFIDFLNKNNNLNVSQLIEKLVEEINMFANGQEQSDDITMLVFTRKR